ncbi:siderophore ABC transporter substrate-binding protein [Methylopila sp. Yamaguchi]|uniref:siderophore ABC transporter substrate-binding protein n=1 Tax=Methylopila sp. Yamaguchi TaxID=1437817 RepID=UPI000CC424B6|nr:siderophore ABC transporter substrate-binding protein [Methylopila sp. Yamaguchi]GBD50479.1 Fe+3 siderophore ABC transporter substrate-binding protein [Methylopila sp. Yamaguchi]
MAEQATGRGGDATARRGAGVGRVRAATCFLGSWRILPLIAALACAVGPASAVEIMTASGPVDVATPLKRVAVYDLSALDTLDRLGVVPAGVPEKLYAPALEPIAAKAAHVGTLFEPDLEALSALKPDLVIVGGRSSPRAEATRKVAPTIDMTMTGGDLVGEAKARLAAYGTLFGRETEAAAAKAELEAAEQAARAAAQGKGTGLILMTTGPKISVFGPGTRFGWVHEALGLPAAIKQVKAGFHGEAASFELIAQANPDWLIVVDRAVAIGAPGATARATLDNELVAGTTAWKKGQVIYLPPADFYVAGGGVQALTRTFKAMTAAFDAAK